MRGLQAVHMQAKEGAGSQQQHADVDSASHEHGKPNIKPDGAQHRSGTVGVGSTVSVADQCRMQINRVRHDGCTEHANRKNRTFGAAELGNQPCNGLRRVRR
jgi:hypothetical protein